MSTTRAQCGFTLIEMLVAISVAALLVSLVYGAIRVGQRSAHALSAQAEESEIMLIGWRFLHDAVTRSRPLGDPLDTTNQTGFRGTSDSLEFVAEVPAYVGIGGTMRIRLDIEADIDGEQLVLSRERYDKSPLAQGAPAIEQAVLIENLERLQISYLGQISDDGGPAWQSHWAHPRLLPNLVRIAVTPAHGRAWPEMIARPLTGTASLSDSTQPSDAVSPIEHEQVSD